MPIKLTAVIVGNALNGFPRSLKQMSVSAKKRLRTEAIAPTIEEIAEKARSLVPVSKGGRQSRKAKSRPGPGELRATIHAEMAKGEALVGFVYAGEGKLSRSSRGKSQHGATRKKSRSGGRSAGSTKLGEYAAVVEFGAPHRGIAAHPYLRPAREASRARFQERCEAALTRAAKDADAAGGGS